jgi:cytidine deaminase
MLSYSNKKIQKIAFVMSTDRQGQPKPHGFCLQYIHDFAKNTKQKVIMSQAKKRQNSPPLD